MANKTRINWRLIERTFIKSDEQYTAEELAAEFDCAHVSVARKMADGKWHDKRKAWQSERNERALALHLEASADELAMWDDNHLAAIIEVYQQTMIELENSDSLDPKQSAEYVKAFRGIMDIERIIHNRNVDRVEHSGSITPLTPEQAAEFERRLRETAPEDDDE
jgi:hypothetical protein